MNLSSVVKQGQHSWRIAALILMGGIAIGASIALLSRESLLPVELMALLFGAALIFGLVIKFFRQTLLLWYSLAPFYYFPYYLSSLGRISFEREVFWLRAAKDAVVLALVVVWLCRLVLLGRSKAKPTLVGVSLLGYIAFGLVRSLGLSLDGTLDVLRLFAEYTIFFFIIQDLFTNEDQLKRLFWVWILSSVGVSLLGVFEYFFGGNHIFTRAAGQTRIISTLYHPNALGWYLVWANGIVLGLYFTSAGRKVRWVLLAIFGLNSGAIILSGSRSSLLTLGVMLCFAVVLSRKIQGLLIVVFAALTIIAFVILVQRSSGVDELRVLWFSSAGRLRAERIKETLPDVFTSPWEILWGHGDIWGREGGNSISVDAQYLNIVYAGGTIGFFLLGIVLLGVGLDLSRLYLRSHVFALPLLLSSFSVLFIGLMGSVMIVFPNSVFFWSSVGLADRLANSKVSERPVTRLP